MRLSWLILLAVLLLPGPALSEEEKVLRVGLYDNAPKVFRGHDGKPQGFWPALLRELASRHNWELIWVDGTWSEHMQALADGRLDIMPDVARNAERDALFRFNNEVALVSWSRVYAADPTIETLTDLANKRIAVLKGSVNYQGDQGLARLLQSFHVPVEFIERESYRAVFEAVESEAADAGVTNKDFGNLNERRFNVHRTPIIFSPADLFFAVPRESPRNEALITAIDSSLQTLKNDSDSAYYRILERTLGIKAGSPVLPDWLVPATLGAGLTILLLGLGNLALNHRVRLHSRALTSEKKLKTAAQEQLANRELEVRMLVDHSPCAIFIKNLQGEYVMVNPQFEKLVGRGEEQVLGKTDAELFTANECTQLKDHDALVQSKGSTYSFEETLTLGGREHVFLTTKFPLLDINGAMIGLCGNALDITQQKEHTAEIHFLAHHDMLTHLPNRRRLEQFVQICIDECRDSGDTFALAFIDLTRFKDINDSLGHTAGDRLLQVISQRIRESLRTDDFLARVGGDEFVSILKNVHNSDDLEEVLTKVVSAFEQPVSLDSREVRIGASVGTALFPTDGEDVDTLMRNADAAMYQAKADGGRTRTRQYYPGLTEAARKRFEMEEALRSALTLDEFYLVYQPQIDLASGELAAMEALVRWQRPDHGPVSPSEFIPVAETSGLIMEIDAWVLNEACRQARAWLDAGITFGRITVNISALELSGHDFVDRILDAIQRHDIPPAVLGVEVTESMLMENIDEVYERLCALSAHGVFIAIDDFGTGYSSLSYLKRLAVNELKIDKSFIDDLPDQEYDRAICETIIQMGRHLGLEVIAEGVETEKQMAYLLEQGCERGQGYWFARPQRPEDLNDWLYKR